MFVVRIPGINGLGKTKGCEKAGNAILSALKQIYTNENGKSIDVNSLDLEEIHVDNSDLQMKNKLIYKNSFEVFETKPKTIFLGGDHSISYPTTRAFFDYCQNHGKKSCLIVFDAHADCMKPMKVSGIEDSSCFLHKFSKEPTHEEWLRALIEDGFPTENILLVGARNLWRDELEFLKKHKIRIITMNQLIEDLQDTCEIIMEFSSNKELYVSVDIDVVDPAFAPATGYKEPGGLTSRQFIYLIQRINKIKNLRAVDIVEINPEKDVDNMTVKLGAKILSELI